MRHRPPVRTTNTGTNYSNARHVCATSERGRKLRRDDTRNQYKRCSSRIARLTTSENLMRRYLSFCHSRERLQTLVTENTTFIQRVGLRLIAKLASDFHSAPPPLFGLSRRPESPKFTMKINLFRDESARADTLRRYGYTYTYLHRLISVTNGFH